MQRSNVYVLTFTVIITVFVGGVLATTSILLKPRQEKAIEWDTKAQILGAVMNIHDDDNVLEIYGKRIKSLVVDSKGDEITADGDGDPMIAEKVSVAKNYKLTCNKRSLPIFKYMNKQNPSDVESYIVPVYGNGLWDQIWGFVALDVSLETIKGISFGHKQETPGLGSRIADDPIVRSRYKGKKIYNKKGKLVSVSMVKGEMGKPLDEHHVDGMSGATMTGKGVNKMLKEYLECYKSYFDKIKSQQTDSIPHLL